RVLLTRRRHPTVFLLSLSAASVHRSHREVESPPTSPGTVTAVRTRILSRVRLLSIAVLVVALAACAYGGTIETTVPTTTAPSTTSTTLATTTSLTPTAQYTVEIGRASCRERG